MYALPFGVKMSYDENVVMNVPKVKKYTRQGNTNSSIRFHVCIPLYKGIPKEFQTGWTRMGQYGVQEWNNTTDTLPFLLKMADPTKFDKKLYCGTCGKVMVKGRVLSEIPPDAKIIKLV